MLRGDVEDLPDQVDDALDRNVALEIAAERGHQAAALDRDAVRLVHGDEVVLRLRAAASGVRFWLRLRKFADAAS